MGLVVDSSVIIAVERGKIDFLQLNIKQKRYISSITITELLTGICQANTEEQRIERSAFIENVISTIPIINFGIDEAKAYAQILHNLRTKNITLGIHDMMIGACAIANGYPVLTMNSKDFTRIKGLTALTVNDIYIRRKHVTT